jgi:CSLREA domain-containing protein
MILHRTQAIQLRRRLFPVTELVVNSTGDGGDANNGDGICETGATNGVCTLRAAMKKRTRLNDACVYITVKFAIPDNDPGHVYYKDDGVPNQVTNDLAHIGVTTLPVASDSSLGDIDPDYPHSWWRIQPAAGLPSIVALDIDGYTQSGANQRNT